MSPRWKVVVNHGVGQPTWWSYSGGEPNTRRLYESTDVPVSGSVVLIRRSEDRKGWVEVDRKSDRAFMVRLAR